MARVISDQFLDFRFTIASTSNSFTFLVLVNGKCQMIFWNWHLNLRKRVKICICGPQRSLVKELMVWIIYHITVHKYHDFSTATRTSFAIIYISFQKFERLIVYQMFHLLQFLFSKIFAFHFSPEIRGNNIFLHIHETLFDILILCTG